MPALFERAIEGEWEQLHEEIRVRYGLVADDDRIAVGRGEMTQLRRSRLALPALWLGTLDDFLFPEAGTNVSFTITTEAFVDGNGHEALFLRREFETGRPRTFVDTLRWNPQRACITDFFGRRGLVVADLSLRETDGALELTVGRQWLRIRGRYLPVPGPLAVDGTLTDSYDEDGRLTVTAEISNPLLGEVFGYDGHFHSELRGADGDVAGPGAYPLGGVRLPGEPR